MKYIETSINIDTHKRLLLTETAGKLGIHRMKLLSLLLEKSRKLFNNRPVLFRAVRYQQREDSADFEIMHVSLTGVDYEYLTGKRYLFKISASFIIALAIEHFLTKISEEMEKNDAMNAFTTNFFYEHFDVWHFDANSVEFWVIPWAKQET